MLKKEWCRWLSPLLLCQICLRPLWLEMLWGGPDCCMPGLVHLDFTASIVANSLIEALIKALIEALIHRHHKHHAEQTKTG